VWKGNNRPTTSFSETPGFEGEKERGEGEKPNFTGKHIKKEDVLSLFRIVFQRGKVSALLSKLGINYLGVIMEGKKGRGKEGGFTYSRVSRGGDAVPLISFLAWKGKKESLRRFGGG